MEEVIFLILQFIIEIFLDGIVWVSWDYSIMKNEQKNPFQDPYFNWVRSFFATMESRF